MENGNEGPLKSRLVLIYLRAHSQSIELDLHDIWKSLGFNAVCLHARLLLNLTEQRNLLTSFTIRSLRHRLPFML